MEGTVAPGSVVARRYRMEERLGDGHGAEAWRAVDEVLGRAVVVHLLRSDDPRAERVARAARTAAAVHDPRFLRVLDASIAEDTLYVVREWVRGRNLAVLLAGGPLPAASAGVLAREVAEAVAAAHAQGLCHLQIDPTTVIVADDGAVKVTGLGTEAAFLGTECDDTAAEDARGIGRVLYAGLTARWPGQDPHLPAAPRVDGRLATPRQVRAGVPRELDSVADRCLGDPPRHGSRLTDPAAVATALAVAVPSARGLAHLVDLGPDDDAARSPRARPVPASTTGSQRRRTPSGVLALSGLGDGDGGSGISAGGAAGSGGVRGGATAAPAPPRGRPPGADPRRGERRMSRAVAVVATALLLAGLALVGWQLLTSAGNGGATSSSTRSSIALETPQSRSPSASASGRPLDVVSALDFDPAGVDGDPPLQENRDRVGLADDGDLATAWTTKTYFDPLELSKPGVGLWVDLGTVQQVGSVRLRLTSAGSDVEVRTAPEDADPPSDLPGWRRVATRADAPQDVTLTLARPVQARYVLVWFTKLPPAATGYKIGVAEVGVRS